MYGDRLGIQPVRAVIFDPHIPLHVVEIPALERKTEPDKDGLFNHNYFMEQLKNEFLAESNVAPSLSVMADSTPA